MFCGTWKESKQKEALKFDLQLNFNNFQKKIEKVLN